MTSAELVRLHAARAPNLMWFLGAGASATSGIPTAGDMIWDFKRSLYCTEQKVSVRLCEDLSDLALQKKIQQFCDSTGQFSPHGSESEYAEYFSAIFPDEADRRRHIEMLIKRGTPTFGHLALSALMLAKRTRIIWTTNFDRNIEDAAVQTFKTTASLSVATLDHAELAMQCLNEERWPLLVKLHGDFSSRRLKNTTQELHTQDDRLRTALVEACKRNGLIVAGYSGRDQSIMDALESCINISGSFPNGLFWITRPGNKPLKQVGKLIANAQTKGINAQLVEANSFDELMNDILLLERELPEEFRKLVDSARPRVTDASLPSTDGDWPVIRLNALPITKFPLLCRKLECDIGGAKEVRQAIENAGNKVIAGRRKSGIIGFGSDIEFQTTFASFSPTNFDLHSIETKRLEFDSVELGLIYNCLCRALSRERGLIVGRRRQAHILAIDPDKAADNLYQQLLNAVGGNLHGEIPGAGIRWSEAVLVRLEYRLKQLWLLFEPTIWIGNLSDEPVRENVKEFHRKRAASRYNQKWNSLLAGWSHIITGGLREATLSTFGITNGVDATFQIHSTTGFSRRIKRA